MLVFGPLLPSLSTLFPSPVCRWALFPLSRVFTFLVSPLSSGFLLPFSFCTTEKFCLAQSLASGCLTRETLPQCGKRIYKVRQCAVILGFARFPFLINFKRNAQETCVSKTARAFRLEISVYSRSDKHLISKMEKPKVAKHVFWNFLVKASCSFKMSLNKLSFPNCLFGFS